MKGAPEVIGECRPLQVSSSLWRPAGHSALWEACFLAVAEALVLVPLPSYSRWSHDATGVIGKALLADIDGGTYDISRESGGQKYGGEKYGFKAAVGEYLYQVWLVAVAGKAEVLTKPQQTVLELLQKTPNAPLTLTSRPVPPPPWPAVTTAKRLGY